MIKLFTAQNKSNTKRIDNYIRIWSATRTANSASVTCSLDYPYPENASNDLSIRVCLVNSDTPARTYYRSVDFRNGDLRATVTFDITEDSDSDFYYEAYLTGFEQFSDSKYNYIAVEDHVYAREEVGISSKITTWNSKRAILDLAADKDVKSDLTIRTSLKVYHNNGTSQVYFTNIKMNKSLSSAQGIFEDFVLPDGYEITAMECGISNITPVSDKWCYYTKKLN